MSVTTKKEEKQDSNSRPYLPSVSTGVFGSYTVLSPSSILPQSNNDEEKTASPSKMIPTREPYQYLPSINSGVFGSYTPYLILPLNQTSGGIFNFSTDPLPSYLELSPDWIDSNGHRTPEITDAVLKDPPRPPRSRGVTILGEWLFNTNNTNNKSNKSNQSNKSNESSNKPKQGSKDNKDSKVSKKSNNVNNVNNVNVLYPKFYVCKGSVVDFTGEAIINAANEGCLGGGGVDGAISSAGGRKLEELRYNLPIIGRYARCRTGSAVITGSGYGTVGCRLECKYVIHAVGPSYPHNGSFKKYDKLLYNAYKTCMDLGKKYQIKTIGFCLLSAGIFRGGQSLETVIQIAIKSIKDNIYDGCKEIYLIGFRNDEIRALWSLTPHIFGDSLISYLKPQQQKKKGNNNKKLKKKGSLFSGLFGR